MEVANGFVDQTRTHPSRRLPVGIGQSASGDANPQSIFVAIIIHPKVGNSSAAAADGDGGRVGGVVGKRRSRALNSRRSGSHRGNVSGVGTRKQGRKREGCTAEGGGIVGVEKVSVGSPSVSRIGIAGGSDARGAARRCRGSAKNPNGLVVVVLAGIDVDEELRVRYPPPPSQRQATTANKNNFRLIRIY